MPMEIVDVANWRAEATCAERLREGRVFLAGRRRARRPAQRRLRRQHGHPGRAQPRVEAGRGRQGRGRAGAARQLRGRAPAALRARPSSRPTRATPRASCPSAAPTACSRRSPTSSSRSGWSCARRRSSARRTTTAPCTCAPAALGGRPGTRAPHVVLADGRSTLDLFGSQFVVLRPAGDGVDDWAPPGAASHVIDAEPFAEAYGLSAGGATLVRPDGVIAWRSRGPAGRDEIARALATALALDTQRAGERQPAACASESRSRTSTRRWRSARRSRRSAGWRTSSGSTPSGATTTLRSPARVTAAEPSRRTRRPTASSEGRASTSR